MPFQQVVFAGGGNRCFWQAGFFLAINAKQPLNIEKISAVSAGSAIACMLSAKKTNEVLTQFVGAVAKNRKNFYLTNIFKKNTVFPHANMFRSAILNNIDEETLALLHQGPDILIQVSQLPNWLGPRSGVLAGLLAYKLEKKLKHPIHPTYGKNIGFKPEVVSIRTCQSPEELADLILSSSCTPPFTPLMYRQKKPVLDGGIVDNVPLDALGDNTKKTLVLLTRQYQTILPSTNLIHYVQPSKPIPISSWDYTNPCGIQAAFELGLRDGEAFADKVIISSTH